MIASATHETYKKVCAIVEEDPNVDSLFIIIVKPPVNTTPKEIINELKPVIEGSPKPFYCTLMARENSEAGLEDFRGLNIPVYSFPESTARVLGNIMKYTNVISRCNKSMLKNYSNPAVDLSHITNKKQAPLQKIMSLLSEFNIKTCEHRLTTEKSDVLEFQKQYDDVALKIANEEIIHKSDQGLVKLNLSSPDEVEKAFDEITQKTIPLIPSNTKPLILVQKMMRGGVELVLGANRNPVFGAVIMFGIGGIFVELYKDVVFRVLPIDEFDAEQMISRLHGKKIMDGFRHLPVIKKDALIKTILNFARMIGENQEIVEMDLNPLIWPVGGREPVAVDSRCTLAMDM
jgi:acetyltransferase